LGQKEEHLQATGIQYGELNVRGKLFSLLGSTKIVLFFEKNLSRRTSAGQGVNEYVEQYAGDGIRYLRPDDTFESTGTVCFLCEAAQGEAGLLERAIFILDADAIAGCEGCVTGATPILVCDWSRNRKAGGAGSAKRTSKL
jgi:hypothetical protein